MPCTNHPYIAEGVLHCSRCGRPFCPDCYVTVSGLTLCAGCKDEQMLDLASGTSATAVTAARYDLASIGRRWAAMFIDKLIMILLIAGGGLFGSLFDHKDEGAVAIGGALAGLVIFIAYETFTTRGSGQTWGKRLLKIRVVAASGGEVGGGQAFGRAVVRTIAVHFLALIDYLPAFFSKERTCVHDLMAGTRVVNAE